MRNQQLRRGETSGPARMRANGIRIQIQREHRKAEAAGTRAPVKANGLPVKAPKPTSLVITLLQNGLLRPLPCRRTRSWPLRWTFSGPSSVSLGMLEVGRVGRMAV